MLTARAYSASAVAGDKLYVIGGYDSGITISSANERFDPATNSWTSLAALPTPVSQAQAAAVGTKIYLPGGAIPSQFSNAMQIYDIETDTWSQGAPLPEARGNAGVASYNGKIYIIGGSLAGGGNYTATVYEYDPSTDQYTNKASMPAGRAAFSAVVIGDTIYAAGGVGEGQASAYAYSPITNTWTAITGVIVQSQSAGGFALDGEMWLVGGLDNGQPNPPNYQVIIYNPSSNSWRLGPILNTPRWYSTAAGSILGRGYVVGGLDSNNSDYLTSMESTTPITCPSPTATPEVTATPAPPTATPTPCTPGSFSDVPPDNTFYPFVTCLVNRNIISGYADCTFRPNAQVTRSQIAKMVSNAADFQEDPGAQIFEDVPDSNPFYQWINRLAQRGHMSGYSCGGDGEPCGVGNLPYFRPFANATRSQLAKIVSNAAGFIDEATGQIFADVPSNHPFYLWVQRLASRQIMGGYACGSEGEPCDSENRPYFRPYNAVTRGQSSKIVAGAFFPGCQNPIRR